MYSKTAQQSQSKNHHQKPSALKTVEIAVKLIAQSGMAASSIPAAQPLQYSHSSGGKASRRRVSDHQYDGKRYGTITPTQMDKINRLSTHNEISK